MKLAQLCHIGASVIVFNWHRHNYYEMTQVQLFLTDTGTLIPSDAGKTVPTWCWQYNSQVRLTQQCPSDIDTNIPMSGWYSYSQVTLTLLFICDIETVLLSHVTMTRFSPSNTSIIFVQMRLTQLFPSDTSSIYPKWD